MEIIQNDCHSARKYETLDVSAMDTQVVALIEQPIKVRHDNGFSMVDAVGVVLKETIFHPQGGGQPSDNGLMNAIPIISVKEDKQIQSKDGNPIIYHFVDQAFLKNHHVTIVPDQRVTITLNTEVRLKHARYHSAGHLIGDILEQNPQFAYLSAKAISGHHFPDEAYIKLLIHTDIEDRNEFIQLLNNALAEAISNDLPVSSYYAGHVRHVQIGASARKCGGTHVSSTQVIESVTVNKIKVSKSAAENDAIAPFELTIFYTC